MRFLPRAVLVLLALPLIASAATPGGKKRPPKKPKPTTSASATASAAPPVPALPSPQVTLSIDPSESSPLWRMRLTNDGDVPVKVLADPRLLSFEGRGKKHPVTCALPEPMRATAEDVGSLVLPPSRSYSAPFDVRKYCFLEGETPVIAAGAQVSVRYGLDGARDSGAAEGKAVAPIDGIEPRLAALPILSSTFTAPPDQSAPAPGDAGAAPPAIDAPRLELRTVSRIDVESPFDVVVPVTLMNRGARPVSVRFRPDTLSFDVVGPGGVEHCAWPSRVSGPLRESFETLAPGAELSLEVELSAYCTAHSFDDSGLLIVRPRLDTREASGASLGIRSFDGEVIGTKPAIVRLFTGRNPRANERPRLDPVPDAGTAEPPPSP